MPLEKLVAERIVFRNESSAWLGLASIASLAVQCGRAF